MKQMRKLAAVLTAGVILGGGIIASQVGAENASDKLSIAAMDGETVSIEHIIGDIAGIDAANAVLARQAGDANYYLAPNSTGETCIVREVPSEGRAPGTCGDGSVVEEFGSVPLLEFHQDGTIDLSAIVRDGVTSASASDGSTGTVDGNVLVMRVGPEVDAVRLSDGSVIPVGRWKD